MASDQTEPVHRFDRGRPGDWHPVQPATASLSIDIEAHDAEVVQERLAVFMTELRAEYGTAVGAMVVEVALSSDQTEPDAGELVEAFARDLCAADPTSAGPATWEVVRENHRDYRREHARALMALGYSRTPAEPDADEREHLAEVLLNSYLRRESLSHPAFRDDNSDQRRAARKDADAVLAAGYSRTPDAHLAAAKAEALEELRERLVVAEQRLRERAPTFWESVERERVSGKAQGVQLALSYVDEALRAARLREQGGE